MTYYSREITTPKTKLEGLQNFVQMIINRLEAGDTREALLTAVDLLGDLTEEGPYSKITDDDGRFARQTAELEAKHQKALAEAIATAMRDGIEEGRRLQKHDTAKAIGLV